MNFKSFISLAVMALLLTSCKTSSEVMWVSGFKAECDAGAAKLNCLYTQSGDDLDQGDWTYHYAPIGGFEFEEGFAKKIKVKKETLDVAQVPQDASSIRYTLVKEINKVKDERNALQGEWILTTMNGGPINRMVRLPTLNIDLNRLRISGNGGCNTYFGQVANIGQNSISLGEIGATLMACVEENIETEYFNVLSQVNSYSVNDNELSLKNNEGEVILTYIKNEAANYKSSLKGKWISTQVGDIAINTNERSPYIIFDFEENRVTGLDGCNNFFGQIENIDNNQLAFGAVGITKMMCHDMKVADAFSQAMAQTASYTLNNNKLIFLDAQGNPLMAFEK